MPARKSSRARMHHMRGAGFLDFINDGLKKSGILSKVVGAIVPGGSVLGPALRDLTGYGKRRRAPKRGGAMMSEGMEGGRRRRMAGGARSKHTIILA